MQEPELTQHLLSLGAPDNGFYKDQQARPGRRPPCRPALLSASGGKGSRSPWGFRDRNGHAQLHTRCTSLNRDSTQIKQGAREAFSSFWGDLSLFIQVFGAQGQRNCERGLGGREVRVLRSQWARTPRREQLPLSGTKRGHVSSRWESGLLKPRLLSRE